ncbi:MAG: hypothetical protein H0X05_03250 [Actinobacteria bacterium]|nr:hypothetical protein [Actinomycetota bacterium]
MAARSGLQVETEEEQVEIGVSAGGAHSADQLGELMIAERSAPTPRPPRLGERCGWVSDRQSRCRGSGKQGAQCGDAGLLRCPTSARWSVPLRAVDRMRDDSHQIVDAHIIDLVVAEPLDG